MDVFETIKTRRSIGKVKDEAPPKALIEKILEAGTWAPSHHRTEPWKFIVLSGNARKRLGEVMAEALRDTLQDPDSQEAKAKLDSERGKPLRAPVIIALLVSPQDKPGVKAVEEYSSVAMAAQNMMLEAQSLGLATLLRTGDATYQKKVNQFFKLKDPEYLFGFIYLGYSAMPAPPASSRVSFKEKTVWLE
ncbi:MAG: nitroreductase [Thaumarchaeota archaeon]|nr:nitroreductase [Nitrososphaerota archaeon]MCL5316731.1 nitroreductase [Nitrososphaerota archaeon]